MRRPTRVHCTSSSRTGVRYAPRSRRRGAARRDAHRPRCRCALHIRVSMRLLRRERTAHPRRWCSTHAATRASKPTPRCSHAGHGARCATQPERSVATLRPQSRRCASSAFRTMHSLRVVAKALRLNDRRAASLQIPRTRSLLNHEPHPSGAAPDRLRDRPCPLTGQRTARAAAKVPRLDDRRAASLRIPRTRSLPNHEPHPSGAAPNRLLDRHGEQRALPRHHSLSLPTLTGGSAPQRRPDRGKRSSHPEGGSFDQVRPSSVAPLRSP